MTKAHVMLILGGKFGQAVIDDAKSFYDTCIQHLEKPFVQSDKSQHHILTFELHNKIAKRPSTLQLVGIPETRKLHQISNTGSKILNFKKFACCCYGCLHGTESCDNNICPTQWSGFDLGKKKPSDANLQYWLGAITQNIRNKCNLPDDVQQRRALNWDAILRPLANKKHLCSWNVRLERTQYLTAIMLQTTSLHRQKQNFWIWWHYIICPMTCLQDWLLCK